MNSRQIQDSETTVIPIKSLQNVKCNRKKTHLKRCHILHVGQETSESHRNPMRRLMTLETNNLQTHNLDTVYDSKKESTIQ